MLMSSLFSSVASRSRGISACVKARVSRKLRQKMSKNTAHFCENRKNHGRITTVYVAANLLKLMVSNSRKNIYILGKIHTTIILRLKPCPHGRRKVRLSQKTARQRRQSHFSAKVLLFCALTDNAPVVTRVPGHYSRCLCGVGAYDWDDMCSDSYPYQKSDYR